MPRIIPAGKALQAWEVKAFDTVYQAATDGFIAAHAYAGATANGISVLTDSANPPTVQRIRSHLAAGYVAGVCCPVKKNKYWKAGLSGGAEDKAVYFIPLS